MKKNKKGFTLVELLAVIVILGVLLLIAVPAIQNVIENSRQKAFLSQTKLAIENVETMLSASDITEKPSTTCSIPVTSIKLERGSWADYAGYIQVAPDNTKDSGYSVTATISTSKYSITGTTLSGARAVDSTYTEATTPTSNTCAFYR